MSEDLNQYEETEALIEFDQAMISLQESLQALAHKAQETDRDDILAFIHGKCQENLDYLSQGIDIAREDDDVDLGRWADLLWMYHYHNDLAHYCVEKGCQL